MVSTVELKFFKKFCEEVKEINSDEKLGVSIRINEENMTGPHYGIFVPRAGLAAEQPITFVLKLPANYPEYPPVLFILPNLPCFWNVNIWRVDVIEKPELFITSGSSACLDILKHESQSGTWKSDFTITGLFATLTQAFVSFYQEQMHGGGQVANAITMELLGTVQREIMFTYNKYKHLFPAIPATLPKVLASQVDTEPVSFGTSIIQTLSKGNKQLIVSDTNIFCNRPYSFSLDISKLKLNPSLVFSVILTSNSSDVTGKGSDVFVWRLGVTATGASSLTSFKAQEIASKQGKCSSQSGNVTKWFYHGQPWQTYNKIHITLSDGQFVFSYEDESGNVYVIGDTPLAYINSKNIGIDISDKPLKFVIFTENKLSNGGIITVPILPHTGKGWKLNTEIDHLLKDIASLSVSPSVVED
jgi:ubiquitin-protein ligase